MAASPNRPMKALPCCITTGIAGAICGRVAADHQIDLVDVEQLRVDAGHRRRIALIVVVDELHRPAEEPALGVDVLLPDLHREERRLAVGREPAGQRHAEADLDRLGGLRRQRCGNRHGGAGYQRGHFQPAN